MQNKLDNRRCINGFTLGCLENQDPVNTTPQPACASHNRVSKHDLLFKTVAKENYRRKKAANKNNPITYCGTRVTVCTTEQQKGKRKR